MKVISTLAVLSLVLLVGCGKDKKEQIGQPIPSNIQVVKLQDILKDSQAYKNREVVLEGNYGAYCCPSDFSYKEGLEGVEVVPAGFESPKANIGKPIRIYGVVRIGEKPKEAEEKEEEEATEAHHDFFIEAKGVQFK